MTEHTPGPWEVTHIYPDSDEKFYDWCGPVVSKGPYICTITQAGTREEAEAMANMRLIAAAPDLLAALEDAVEAMHANGMELSSATQNARAAIAKARR